jgi:Mn-dependent DtxR family transcriptional regulator
MLEVVDQNTTADRLELDILRARSELQRRFATGSGCAARAVDYARLLSGVSAESVEEALHRLADEGVVRMHCLSDGALAFHFPAA